MVPLILAAPVSFKAGLDSLGPNSNNASTNDHGQPAAPLRRDTTGFAPSRDNPALAIWNSVRTAAFSRAVKNNVNDQPGLWKQAREADTCRGTNLLSPRIPQLQDREIQAQQQPTPVWHASVRNRAPTGT